ncbi:MAG: FtsX-like permease family protein, partial [bacterium]|nr:FtsX-like permease family protein [bacterium]
MSNKRKSPPKIARWILSKLVVFNNKHALSNAIEEMYYEFQDSHVYIRSWIWFWYHTTEILFQFIRFSSNRSVTMFKNYIKIAIRNIIRHRGYSFINISGLALGMTCCTLIALSVLDEIYYNTFHENTERIYCVGNYQTFEGNVWHVSSTPSLLAPALQDEFPEVTSATRYTGFGQALVKYGERSFFENRIYHVDPDFLKIFTFPLIKGDRNTALNDPHSIVISQNMAEKYFPGEDPLGKTITINDLHDFTVTGVIRNVPHNSSLIFEMLVPFKFKEDQYRKEGRELFHWRSNNTRTYIMLQDEVMADAVHNRIKNFVRGKTGTDEAPEFTIIPLKNYRFSRFGGGPRRIRNLTIFSSIAFIILLIASINFMNLSTARSANRAKEIGLRKVVGACRKNVIVQFLGESLILSFSALLLAVIMVILLLPMYNEIFGNNLPVSILTNSYVIPVLAGIALITGFIGGSYPAFFLSSFRPVTTLKGDLSSGAKSSVLRKTLVVFQFVLSISLIIGTVVIYKQIDFIKNKDMGFEKENIIYVPLRAGTAQTYQILKNRLESFHGIESVTGSSHKPTSIGSNTTGIKWEGKKAEYNTLIHVASVDYDYVETLNMELIEGRDFSSEFPSDRENSFLINERLMKDINKESVMGDLLESSWIGSGKIIGVIKDFHFRPVNDEIPPLVIQLESENHRYAMIRILPDNIASTLRSIRETWE